MAHPHTYYQDGTASRNGGRCVCGSSRRWNQGNFFCSMPQSRTRAFYKGSGIVNLQGDRVASLVEPAPNTNLVNPRTVIPTLRGRIRPGEHRLLSMVLGEPDKERAAQAWPRPPDL